MNQLPKDAEERTNNFLYGPNGFFERQGGQIANNLEHEIKQFLADEIARAVEESKKHEHNYREMSDIIPFRLYCTKCGEIKSFTR